MSGANPFDYVNAINSSKQNLIRESENEELAEKDYNPFITNRQLSYFLDTVFFANDMNERHGLFKLAQFDYLINIVRPRKRFAKFAKAGKSEHLEAISEYYGYNAEKAEEILSLLTNEQIEMIRTKIQKGGTK